MTDDELLTRRDVLARAGAGAAVLLGSAAVGTGAAADAGPASTTAAATTPATAAPPPMLKGISLIGDVNPYADTLGVRPYLLSGPRPVDVVALWIQWPRVQPIAPQPFTELQAFLDLSDPAGPAAPVFAELDGQIAIANADGRHVLLTVYQSFPDWTRPSAGPLDAARDPARGGPGYPELGQGSLANDARIVDDLTLDGPWAWFVAYLCARYARVAGAPPTAGPGRGAAVGNPRGAHVDWLQPMNEPNLTWWPQRGPGLPNGTIDGAIAAMMRTAATVAARYRNGDELPQGPTLLMPGTSDVVHPDSEQGTPWRAFTDAVLAQLAGWEPETAVGWAHHNYADVKHGVQDSGRWRVEDVLVLLAQHGWPDPSVWLTEGGYEFGVVKTGDGMPATYELRDPFGEPAEQARLIQENWAAMTQLPVRLWTQYLVNDANVRFQSGLRGPVSPGPGGATMPHDPPYPAYEMWPSLGE